MNPAEWVFRHAGGCLIETPDLPTPTLVPGGVPWRWTATLWPDPYRVDGWAALEWASGERGWWVPVTLAVGDVVEFGITWADSRRGIDGPTVRWFGWLERTTERAAIIHGPHHHPDDAYSAARSLVDEVRLTQLAAPVLTSADESDVGIEP